VLYANAVNSASSTMYRAITNTAADYYIYYNTNGTYSSSGGLGSYDCVTNAWSLSQLAANGRTFNIVNGSAAATASITDGTAGAPGIYFDADQDTGLYRPAANTIGFSTGGSEKVRIDGNGAISLNGATASAGAILDLGAATGTAASAIVCRKHNTNRPTTGVAGMLRYNTTTNQSKAITVLLGRRSGRRRRRMDRVLCPVGLMPSFAVMEQQPCKFSTWLKEAL